MKIEAEQILLIILFLLLSAGSITMGVLYSVPPNKAAEVPKSPVPDFDPSVYDPLPDSLHTIPPWKESAHKFFVPPILAFYPDKKLVKRLDLNEPDKYGVTGVWKKKYGFALDDPDVALADPDNDGFSNMEEFKAGTDPLDPHSTPPPIQKLRMESYVSTPFRIMFMGYSKEANGTWALQLNFNGTSRLVHEGDHFDLDKMKVSNTGWRIGPFRMKIVKQTSPYTGEKVDVDLSELDFHHPLLDDRVVTLVRGKPTESDDRKVTFVALLPNAATIPPVKLGETFEFRGSNFQLINANKDEAELKGIPSGEIFHIRLMNDEDKAKLQALTAPPPDTSTQPQPPLPQEH